MFSFLGYKAILSTFTQFRKMVAKSVKVWRAEPNIWTALSENEPTGNYIVSLSPQRQHCTCADFHKQVEYFNRGCCKHMYAALNTIGFSNLSDYTKSN